jgi:uncharacterized delta-60 repeat protein
MLFGSKEIPMMRLVANLLSSWSRRTSRKTAASPLQRAPLGVEQLEERLVLHSAYLDPTFGPGLNGTVFTDFHGNNDIACSSTFQADGKIVVVGSAVGAATANCDVAVARYTANGTLDPTFGVGGTVWIEWPLEHAEAHAVAVQPDGKIVMAGFIGDDYVHEFLVLRSNSDGSPDTSFGHSGVVRTQLYGGWDEDERIDGLALQTDGKIVVAGHAGGGFELARYDTDGSLDTSFGPDHKGTVHTFVGNSSSAAHAVAIQADGKILAAGQAATNVHQDAFALVRYNQDGSIDTSFGPQHDGKVLTTFANGVDSAFSLVLTGNKIVAVGECGKPQGGQQDFAAARYNLEGSLDNSFGPYHDGKVAIDFGWNAQANSVAVQSNGDLVLAGWANGGNGGDFALARLHADGSLDTTIGNAGLITTTLTGGDDGINHVLLQADGKIVAAGYGGPTDNEDFALARYDLNQKQWPTIDPNKLFKPGPQSIDPPPPTLFVGPEVQFISSTLHASTAGATMLRGTETAMVSPGVSLADLSGAAQVQHAGEAHGSPLQQKLSIRWGQVVMTLDFAAVEAAFAEQAFARWE